MISASELSYKVTMRILFSCVGRRVELIQTFREAAEYLNMKLEIWGTDITSTAPALYFCDHICLVPRIRDTSYIPTLARICADNDIDLLIPTIDTDLLLLAENIASFDRTKVLISRPDKIAICRDKRNTADYFCSIGLKSPRPTDDIMNYHDGFPAFIKPKDGSSSIFAYKAENYAALEEFTKQVPDYIIQPFIEGTEYTVDILCDTEGKPLLITPRIRSAVRAGEVLKTEIRQDDRIIAEMKQLLSDFKPCGPITVQLIRDSKTGEDYYIEINPRFGGGAPLAMKAGANSAEFVLRMAKGETLVYTEKAAEDGAVFSRFDQSVRVK